MLKIFLISLTFTMSISTAISATSQIVTLPDGRQMVCWYSDNGRFVNCQYL